MAEEWYRDAHMWADAEALSRAEIEKTVWAIKQEQYELTEKLKEAQSARLRAEAGLKTAEKQAEDQHQMLHVTEINLATEKQTVLDLKAALQKAKEENGQGSNRGREESCIPTWHGEDASKAYQGTIRGMHGLL